MELTLEVSSPSEVEMACRMTVAHTCLDLHTGDQQADGNYKSESQFATHLKTNNGASAFSRSKTLKEQREYLPAFACREDLMRTIRENQGRSDFASTFLPDHREAD